MDSSSALTTRPGLTSRWWEHAIGVMRVSPRTTSRTLRDLIGDLDRIADLGFDVIELFAPGYGGTTYEGLDVIAFDVIDPVLGTMDDFTTLVQECHHRGIALIPFLNLGYVNDQFAPFLRACDNMRQNLTTDDTRLFIWADSPDASLPYPVSEHFLQGSDGRWLWSDRAQHYFWVKWEGESGDAVLPQLNWGDPGWRREAARILDFWRSAGTDGVVLDAVNWYVGCDWASIRALTVEAGSPGYSHPEGAGGFNDDPVPWVASGGFTVLMDYSLRNWWEGFDLLRDAVGSGDFASIEEALTGYRDAVAAAGGICYINPPRPESGQISEARLAAAVIATVGQLYYEPLGIERLSPEEREITREMLELRRAHPSLTAQGPRTVVPCSDPSVYAFVRGTGSDRVLVALNFSGAAVVAECEMPADSEASAASVPVDLAPHDFVVVGLPPRIR